MRSFLRTGLSWLLISLVLTIALAVFGEWFIEVAKDKGLYENAGTRWDSIVSAISGFILSHWLLYPSAVLLGLVFGLRLDSLLRKKERADPYRYFPTMIRLQKDPNCETNYISVDAKNIFTWQSTYQQIEFERSDGSKHPHTVQNFFFVFKEDIGYAQPKIKSFGHVFPLHQWHGLTERSAILIIDDAGRMPMFEVEFPPIPKEA